MGIFGAFGRFSFRGCYRIVRTPRREGAPALPEHQPSARAPRCQTRVLPSAPPRSPRVAGGLGCRAFRASRALGLHVSFGVYGFLRAYRVSGGPVGFQGCVRMLWGQLGRKRVSSSLGLLLSFPAWKSQPLVFDSGPQALLLKHRVPPYTPMSP